MTLLEDVEKYVELLNVEVNYFDPSELAEETKSTVEEVNIFLDTVRWGHLEGTVFSRSVRTTPDYRPVWEYVMVTEYVYSGDSDGDMELTASVVYPHEVTTIEWRGAK
jgi:hypothetical protein